MQTETPVRKRPERSCAGCRQKDVPEALVRLVLGDDGRIVPDLAGGAFGRGAWVHGRPDCIDKGVRGGLSRSFRQPVTTSVAELSSLICAAADRRVAGLILAARRSGKLAIGSVAVEQALDSDNVSLVVVARDARAAAETDRVRAAIAAGRAAAWGTKATLGAVLGRDETGVVAVLDNGLGRAVSSAIALASLLAPRGSKNSVRVTEVS